MSKFLTPSTVSLLFLIKLYCGGYVPPDGQLSVMAFIISRILPESTQNIGHRTNAEANPINHFSLTLQDLGRLLSPWRCTLRNLAGSATVEKNLWEFFALCLCAVDGLDKLLEETNFLMKLLMPDTDNNGHETSSSDSSSESDASQRVQYEILSRMSPETQPNGGSYTKTPITKGSLFGVYVAQALVEYEKLKFEDAMKVWRDFERFRRPLVEHLAMHTSRKGAYPPGTFENFGDRVFEIINHSLDHQDCSDSHPSSSDVEKMLEFQINQMQKFGARVPKQTKMQLKAMIGSEGSKSNLSYYASFLDAWYQGDYTSSLENLHRYYDYAMQHTDRAHYQYALLNMAILQADFGSFTGAAAAMKETIATARENKDMSCLSYCLSWLYRFEALHGGYGTESVLNKVLKGAERGGLGLLYLKAAAREHGMHSVESQAMLQEAAGCLSQGHRPLEAFERIYESSHLVLHHQLNGMRASQTLMLCSIYARLGVTPLARSLCHVVLDCFSKITPEEEIVQAICRNSYMLALVGSYDLALDALRKFQADPTRNIKCQQYLAQCVGIIELKRALHRHDLFLAERLIAALKSTPSHDQNLAFLASLFEINYLMRLGSWTEAFELINSHLSKSGGPQYIDVYQRIRLMNAKAFLFAKTGRPQKGFSISLRAATAAYRSKNSLALWESVVAIVGVLNGLKEWKAAVDVAESSIYQATETEEIEVVAQLLSVGADSLMGRARELKADGYEHRRTMNDALTWIDSACQAYEQLEDYRAQCELTLKARAILNYFGVEQGVKERSDKLDRIEELISLNERWAKVTE